MPNFGSDILVNIVRTNIPLISISFLSHLDFRFSFSLVDDNAKCFRHFWLRFRRRWRKTLVDTARGVHSCRIKWPSMLIFTTALHYLLNDGVCTLYTLTYCPECGLCWPVVFDMRALTGTFWWNKLAKLGYINLANRRPKTITYDRKNQDFGDGRTRGKTGFGFAFGIRSNSVEILST